MEHLTQITISELAKRESFYAEISRAFSPPSRVLTVSVGMCLLLSIRKWAPMGLGFIRTKVTKLPRFLQPSSPQIRL